MSTQSANAGPADASAVDFGGFGYVHADQLRSVLGSAGSASADADFAVVFPPGSSPTFAPGSAPPRAAPPAAAAAPAVARDPRAETQLTPLCRIREVDHALYYDDLLKAIPNPMSSDEKMLKWWRTKMTSKGSRAKTAKDWATSLINKTVQLSWLTRFQSRSHSATALPSCFELDSSRAHAMPLTSPTNGAIYPSVGAFSDERGFRNISGSMRIAYPFFAGFEPSPQVVAAGHWITALLTGWQGIPLAPEFWVLSGGEHTFEEEVAYIATYLESTARETVNVSILDGYAEIELRQRLLCRVRRTFARSVGCLLWELPLGSQAVAYYCGKFLINEVSALALYHGLNIMPMVCVTPGDVRELRTALNLGYGVFIPGLDVVKLRGQLKDGILGGFRRAELDLSSASASDVDVIQKLTKNDHKNIIGVQFDSIDATECIFGEEAGYVVGDSNTPLAHIGQLAELHRWVINKDVPYILQALLEARATPLVYESAAEYVAVCASDVSYREQRAKSVADICYKTILELSRMGRSPDQVMEFLNENEVPGRDQLPGAFENNLRLHGKIYARKSSEDEVYQTLYRAAEQHPDIGKPGERSSTHISVATWFNRYCIMI